MPKPLRRHPNTHTHHAHKIQHRSFQPSAEDLQKWFTELYPTQALSRYGLKHAVGIVAFIKSPAGKAVSTLLREEQARLLAQIDANRAAHLFKQRLKLMLMLMFRHYLAQKKREQARLREAERQTYEKLYEEESEVIDKNYETELDMVWQEIQYDEKEKEALDDLIVDLEHWKPDDESWFHDCERDLIAWSEEESDFIPHFDKLLEQIKETADLLRDELALDAQKIEKDITHAHAATPLSALPATQFKQLKLAMLQDTQAVLIQAKQNIDPKLITTHLNKVKGQYEVLRDSLLTQTHELTKQRGQIIKEKRAMYDYFSKQNIQPRPELGSERKLERSEAHHRPSMHKK